MPNVFHHFFPTHNPRLAERVTLILMLTPYVVGIGGLVVVPSLLALVVAFADYDALTPPHWVGLAHFHRLLTDRLYGIALGNTLLYLALAVPLRVGGAFLLALVYKRQRVGIGLARSSVYLPIVIPNVAYGLIWLITFNPQFGPINVGLRWLALPAPAWTSEPWPALWALVIMAAWQLGEGFLILLTAVRNIPHQIYEASMIDGANSRAIYRHITLPLMLPSLLLLSARDLIVCLQATFVSSLIVTQGGPGYSTLFIPLYTYWLAFDDLRLGYAAAVAWSMYLLTLAILLVQFVVVRRWQHDGVF